MPTKDYDRVIEVIHRLGISADFLWPEGVKKGIKKAFSVRNKLFHEALTDNPHVLFKNISNFQYLLEHIVLKSLNVKELEKKYCEQ